MVQKSPRWAAKVTTAFLLGSLVLCACMVQAKVFYHDEFNSLDGWVMSEHKDDYGKFELSAGSAAIDPKKEQGLKLIGDSKFFAISKELPTPVSNDGTPLVISYSVKSEQGLKCGGTYLKFLSELDQKDFHGESPYWLMFGPDNCGDTHRIHIILHHNGENHLWKIAERPKQDKATHVYTLELAPNNTYQLYVDGAFERAGSLEEEWAMVPPKMIADPDDKKPDDWVDDEKIPDTTDSKPEDWDEQATIPDEKAVKPSDWNDAEDGEWEPPQVANPNYRGKWRPRAIPNPDFKGEWKPKQIPNPAYKEDLELYKTPAPLRYVGIDVWQVQSGSIFDNIIVGDDLQEVLALVKSTYGAMAEQEKKLVEAEEEREKAAMRERAEAARREAAEREASAEDAKDDDDDL